jgi:myo-inositol 2-dehydrogenase / D-chiro-inositol 1-dehydrogenase
MRQGVDLMKRDSSVSRRQFIGGTIAATVGGSLWGSLTGYAQSKDATSSPAATKFKRKIKLGVVGLGGRGRWISDLFKKHGGFDIHAVADYFPGVVEEQGKVLGVDAARRFSGLSGYKKVIESGVEAIVIIDIPYFYTEQAKDAVDAGLHIYMAKPVAVDVPGSLAIGELGKRATQKQRVFLVDYQMPTDPHNIEVYRRIAAGALGPMQTIFSTGAAGGGTFDDPPFGETIENRMKDLLWVNDDALGCGYIGNYDIHVVDAVLRAVGRMPVSAYGWGERFRAEPHGDALDSTCVMYTFDDGMVWNHQSPKGTSDNWFLPNGSLVTEIQGRDASARISYWGKAYVRGGKQYYNGGTIENLYDDGAIRNIAMFYDNVTKGQIGNDTVPKAVDSALVCILGREAAARHTSLTMEQVLKENRKLEINLKGLKA